MDRADSSHKNTGHSDQAVFGQADEIRLQLYLARAGVASRRASEKLVTAGRVKVNGKVLAELGARVRLTDRVELDGQLLELEQNYRYLALNKPAGYISSMKDEWQRPTAASLLKPDIKERVYNIGRLDKDSCGLLLFSNDGAFAARLGHPSSGILKEYYVLSDQSFPRSFADSFVNGIKDMDEVLKAEQVLITGDKSCLIKLTEGKNREIRRALRVFNLRAILLRRIAIGPVKLGSLEEGSWRDLTIFEKSALFGEKT